jgi:class 3 adenylate cyclase
MQIKKQFEHYLAPEIVKKLQKNPDMLKLGGDTQELSILFSDIRGFTTISEQFKDDVFSYGIRWYYRQIHRRCIDGFLECTY